MPLPFESREEVLAWICKKSAGAAQSHAGAEEVPHWKAVQCEASKARWKRQQSVYGYCQASEPRRNCVKLTQFLPLRNAKASVSRLQSGTMSANPTLPVLKKFMRGVEIMEQMMPGTKEKSCPGNSKSVMPICTASPKLIFRTASRSCTRFCTRKTVQLRSRANQTTLESTTLRWKPLSGDSAGR